MTMSNKGLTKIVEECGELIQICAKKIAYMKEDFHPDGQFMRGEIEKEMADVLASIEFVAAKWNLNREVINNRMTHKLRLYNQWDKEPVEVELTLWEEFKNLFNKDIKS